MKTLAVVPARGGSKGLPGKNARPFLGVPLLARAVQVALETCDDVVVTTDSPDLMELAYRHSGIGSRQMHYRPAELATDEAPMLPVVQDAIRGREGDVIVLLQPTQPLRTAENVRAAIDALPGWDSVVSVRSVPEVYRPDRVLHYQNGVLFTATGAHCERRQDARPAFVRCGTVYVARRSVLEGNSLYGSRCNPFWMPGDALSIDTLEDFERLEALARPNAAGGAHDAWSCLARCDAKACPCKCHWVLTVKHG